MTYRGPSNPVAEWVVKHLHVTLSRWQWRLLDELYRKDQQ